VEHGQLLPSLVAHLEATHNRTMTIETTLAWAQIPSTDPGSSVGPRRMTIARGFARFMTGFDPATEVPPVGLLPHRVRRRIPYLFSEADIQALMDEASKIPTRLRAATHRTLIGLLAVTGMRIGEAIRLERRDVDWQQGVLTIRDSKFGKSRELPLHPTTVQALADYARLRDRHLPRPSAANFFVSTAGTQLIYAGVWLAFRDLIAATGVGKDSPITPRPHDVKHSFTVNTVIDWYRAGEDIATRLPRLSTYLGHREPRHTYTYLSASPELLALAAARLETTETSS